MSATRFIPLLLCDAFAEECFAGNPAAVCYIPTEVYQPNGGVSPTDPRDVLMGRAFAKIANEMNLSETAFVYRLPEAAVAAAKATIEGGQRRSRGVVRPTLVYPRNRGATVRSRHPGGGTRALRYCEVISRRLYPVYGRGRHQRLHSS
ncbi:hypothetical protein AGDE_13738 [Angomonas deanei]|uniref:Phenazine biosynthesis-like protein, putative n=1 Tax=Angomonas deanei TaxID=59799 RepID=A0A7G2CU09_9TRYP|nr:hypothetical protein AGDE_13738 [Angomonas deanei]CAD2221722.1 Phenazine biosynthesis-like protein, putative [Angomonas deanei]|eukprot:EPY21802.1 hypothetical protein AGDE_13738 [Angomonas deanei]